MKRKLIFFLLPLAMLAAAWLLPRYQAPAMGVVHQHLESPPDQQDLTGFQEDGSLTSHLPIVILHTDGRTVPGGDRSDHRELDCAYTVFDSRTGLNSTADAPTLEGRSRIAIRGNSSRYYPKSQYIFKTVDAEGRSRDVPLLGMPAESVWVLNGSYIDHSQLRNYILYNLSGEIMDYAPRCRLCEVFTTDAQGNPVYQGLYTLIEKIKVSDVRLDLDKVHPGHAQTSFLMQMNARIDNARIRHLLPDGIVAYSFDLEYPSDPPQDSVQYVQQQLLVVEKSMYDAIRSGDWSNFNRYVDLDSFVDYYLINEFFQNLDAGTRSTYLHRDLGGRMAIGPVWDFDGAMNNFSDVENRYDYLKVRYTPYYRALFQNPVFVERCIRRYRELRQGILSEASLLTYIDQSAAYVAGPAERNARRWYEGEEAPWQTDVEAMKEFVRQRGKWMDENFEALSTIIK